MEEIILKTFSSDWHNKFEKEKILLENALGNVVFKTHHIGSTSIPDLLAKPIIDISIEAFDFPPSQRTIEKLSSLGYINKGKSGVTGRYWFTKGEPRQFNLHYCCIGSEVVKKQTIFKDKLMASESLRREYEAIKLNNAKGRDIDSSEYALAKTGFIERVINE
jgi:GrpB-like predicted nucleotidyltransferase (UPF0157 family)